MPRRNSNPLALCITLTSVLLAFTWPTAMGSGDVALTPGVLPPQFSQIYSAGSEEWWEWALSLSNDESPLLDLTGAKAANGESGFVWFLAGAPYGQGTVDRTITIPPGKVLFFPLYNYIWVNTPEFGDPPWSPEQEAFTRALASDAIDQVTELSAEIDGRRVRDIRAYRFQTGEPFMVTMPDDNYFGIPAGTYGPSVGEGYYLLLAPFLSGRHTIHFRTVAGGNVQDVTYHIRVGR
jgi:hypothetical protein